MVLLQRKNGNWASCLTQLAGKFPADASKLMKDRIQRGKIGDKEHYQNGAWTSENFNVVSRAILGARAEYNPLIKYVKEATDAHKSEKEFYLTLQIVDAQGKPYSKVLIEIAEQDESAKLPIEKRRVANFGQVQTHNVATNSFADDPQIAWLARGKTNAKNYGSYLRNKVGINSVIVYNPEIFTQDFARGFWLCRLDSDNRSNFGCYGRSLFDDNGSVFGEVPSESAEGTARKISGHKVRVSAPSLAEMLKYARPYVLKVAQKDFEAGLSSLYRKK